MRMRFVNRHGSRRRPPVRLVGAFSERRKATPGGIIHTRTRLESPKTTRLRMRAPSRQEQVRYRRGNGHRMRSYLARDTRLEATKVVMHPRVRYTGIKRGTNLIHGGMPNADTYCSTEILIDKTNCIEIDEKSRTYGVSRKCMFFTKKQSISRNM